MEEGVPPMAPRRGSRPTSAASPESPNSSSIVPYSPSAAPCTYVVQAPKDQIFRVPPPENALLVEQYRNTLKNQRRVPACYAWLAKGAAAALIVLIACLIAVLIFYLVVKPADPSFAVGKIVAIGGSRTKSRFDVTLRAKNPSAKMGYFFEKGGKTSLSSNGKKIGSGSSTAFDVDSNNSKDVKLILSGSKAALPERVKKSLKGSKDVVSLSLSVVFPVRSAVAGMKWWSKQMNVECDVRASNLAKGARIVSQKCEAKFQ